MKTVAFTGHRPDKLGGYNEDNPIAKCVKHELSVAIDAMIGKGYRRFIHGGALGVDTWAGEIVSDYALWYGIRTDIKIYSDLFRPFENQEAKWPKECKIRYLKLMDRCDNVITVCEPGYASWKMQKRNEAMVDASDLVIAVWDGTDGGTANCVRYAQRKGKEIVIINPRDVIQ